MIISKYSNKNALKLTTGIELICKDEKVGKLIFLHLVSGINDMAVGQIAVDNTELYINGPYTLIKIDSGHWLIQESFEEFPNI